MSKKCYLIIFTLICSILHIQSQVTIGSGTPPDKDALLDLKESPDGISTKGFALPRVSLVSTINPSPMSDFLNGMVVYNIATTDEGSNSVEPGFYFSDGYQWIELKSIRDIIFPNEPWRVAGSAEQASQNTQDIYQDGQVLIGRTGQVDISAQLEVASTERGILVPRLTSVQRDAIQNPSESLLIWNTDIGCFNFRRNGRWRLMCGDLEESDIAITKPDCSSAKVIGIYKDGTPLSDANYLMVTVQVIQAGSFSIQADSQKGFFFQKTGSFPSTGTYTVKLDALGTPKEAGTFNITLNINGEDTDCQIPVTVAVADVKFDYIAGTAKVDDLIKGESSEGKTLTVDINVINAGTFNFSTASAYGIQFTLNNQTLSVGRHTIVLQATGVPTVSGQGLILNLEGTGIQAPYTATVNILVSTATLNIDCSNASVNGIYKLNRPTTVTNFIDIPVNFTKTGSWTATTNTVTGFSFSGSGTTNTLGNNIIRLYATGIPNDAGKQTFTVTVNDVATCDLDVTVVQPTKNVLLIGNVSSYISVALANTSNFGVSGISKIESINVIKGPNNPSATELTNLINNNNIHVIISGWSFKPSAGTASVISDFIKNKRGYLLWAQSQGLQKYIPLILDKAFGTTATFTPDSYPLRATIFPNIDTPYTNGVFGDVSGKYLVSDDTNSWIGLTTTSKTGDLKWFVELPTSGNYPARYTFLYGPGFFMFPDWGMLGKVGGYYGNNSPISFNSNATSNTNVWNGSSLVVQAISVGNVANWVLFGNVMNYAFEYVDDNFDTEYNVSGNN